MEIGRDCHGQRTVLDLTLCVISAVTTASLADELSMRTQLQMCKSAVNYVTFFTIIFCAFTVSFSVVGLYPLVDRVG